MATGKGHPRSFKTDEIFKQAFRDYITHCIDKDRFPNIAGFCVYSDITRDTYYAQQEYYSDTYNKTRQMLEDEVLQDNSYRMQLYLKNTFGYKDKQEIEQINTNIDITLSETEKKARILELEQKRKG